MVVKREHSAEEGRLLQQCIDDLTQIQAFSKGAGESPLLRLPDLLDMLLHMLDLELVYARLRDPLNAAPIELARTAHPHERPVGPAEIGSILTVAFGPNPQNWPSNGRIAFCDVSVLVAATPLGPQGELGILAAASARTDFPEETEKLRLDAAASQAVIALQQGGFSRERRPTNITVAPPTEGIAVTREERGDELEQLRRAVEALRVREIDIQSIDHWALAAWGSCGP